MNNDTDTNRPTGGLRLIADIAAFLCLALASLLLLDTSLQSPAAWLPTGYAIGLLFTHGRQALPSVVSGTLLAALVPALLGAKDWVQGMEWWLAVSLYTLIAALVTWQGYRRVMARQFPLVHYTAFLWFLGTLTLAGFVATLPFLGIGYLNGGTSLPDLQQAILQPWFAGFLGAVLIAPLVMGIRHRGLLLRALRRHLFESTAWFASLGFILLVVWYDPLQNLYLMFPVTIWAATRFSLQDAMLAISGAGLAALASAIAGLQHGHNVLEAYLVIEGLTAMIVAASFYVRVLLKDRERIEYGLEDVVEQRTRELQIANFELKDEIFVRQQAEKSFRRSSQHFRALFETASNPIIVVDDQIVIRQWNGASEQLFGYSRDEAIGRNLSTTFIPAEQQDELSWKILKLFSSGLPQETLETEIHGFNGSRHFILWNLSRLNDEDDPGQRRLILIGQDITEIRQSQSQLHYLAHYDVLTNTANRRLFEDRCKQAISSAIRHRHSCALICLDVDHFKRINDTLGHDAGDRLLQELSNRLHTCVREEDTIGRLGGDEFAVLLTRVNGAEGCEKVARSILEAIVQPITVPGGELVITSSIGITLAPGDARSYEQLLKNADMAMYRAKNAGRNNIQFFSADMNEEMQRQITLERELRYGINNGQLDLHYQPVFQVRDGKIIGLEALLRWHHPSRGVLTPGEFLDVAEQTGLLQPLGEWICHNACLQARAIQAMSGYPVSVRINLSSRQYNHPRLAEQVDRIIRDTRLDPALMLVEIDERILNDRLEETACTLHRLKEIGVGLVLDRYGSGLSTLKLLRDLPFDQVKIDQHLLHLAPSDENTQAIIHTLINLARQLSLTVAAAGVETEEQDLFLRTAGCHLLQGHRFCSPVASGELPDLFAQARQNGPILPESQIRMPFGETHSRREP